MPNFSKVFSAQTAGLSGRIVEVEVDITKKSLFAFSIVGLPDKAVQESRDRVSAAVRHLGFTSPKQAQQKTVVSLAPADLKKEGPLFDVAIALAYLSAIEEIMFHKEGKLFLGELALDGVIRPIKGALVLTLAAKKAGFKEIFVPKENAEEAALVDGISVFGAGTLAEVIAHISIGATPNIPPMKLRPQPHTEMEKNEKAAEVDMRDVRGQEHAKRGLEIAAAGGHNVVLFGPPGTGKTMLARALAGVLPKLDFDEALEVTSIHSVAGTLDEPLISTPPFRAPHHTSSYTAIVGGGTVPRPGEITLAHKGVLFLDEFPEFEKRVLEALRQPLEDGAVTVARVKGVEKFPARVLLLAAMNPCPCGNKGSDKRCTCPPSTLQKYERKLSGPIIDRIDLWLSADHIPHDQLKYMEPAGEESKDVRKKVKDARERQKARYADTHITKNAELDARSLNELAGLTSEGESALQTYAKQKDISPRAYHRIIKVARTIADLAGSEKIEAEHVGEALQYRPHEKQG